MNAPLPPTSGTDKGTILGALERLQAGPYRQCTHYLLALEMARRGLALELLADELDGDLRGDLAVHVAAHAVGDHDHQ